ncbi:MAG: DUF2442 domain-containing protein [Epsilonproteobacteria bacterium]|nr:MAG: DUF2442 domain-containing protein [Campylobacterota bacterium]
MEGKEVYFDEEYLHVKLEDNRIISTPIEWYAPLKKATIEQLKDYKLICLNTGIEWESIDYHLNIENMLEVSLKKVA